MRYCHFILFSVFALLLYACQGQATRQSGSGTIQEIDGQYDSNFPVESVSDYLEEFSSSVYLVSILAFYQSYYFSEQAQMKEIDLTESELSFKSSDRQILEQPSSGTALLVYDDRQRIAFLTCAHVVDYPDTIVVFHHSDTNIKSDYVQALLYKVRQTNTIINQPLAQDFEVLAIDQQKDLALIGKKLNTEDQYDYEREVRNKLINPQQILKISPGRAKDLRWGTFVYILGFPQAKKMISRAIVSNPDYDNQYSFLLDASLQKGISGGLIIALRDGVPNFEWVGIARGISGRTEYQIVPETDVSLFDWERFRPYEGKIYLEKKEIPTPGITYAIGIETILEFLRENDSQLRRKGYQSELFFKQIRF